jgi:hypothetical protein
MLGNVELQPLDVVVQHDRILADILRLPPCGGGE